MTTSITSITEGQKELYKRVVRDAAKHGTALALEKTGADQTGWQRVIENGDDLRESIAATIVAKTRELSLSNQFANEEVRSSYGYPNGYAPKPIEAQVAILRKTWPKINVGGWVAQFERTVTPGAEAHFVIVRWQVLAPSYSEGLEKELFPALHAQRNGAFYNYRNGELGPKQLRQHEHTVRMLAKLDANQPGDVLVVSAQLGFRHRGRSVRRAREVFVVNELGLGAFHVGCILLSHPKREVQWEQLHMDCPGDEFSPRADGRFSHAPYFHFCGGRLEFSTSGVGGADGGFGSASALLPQ